jgi:3-methyladenine DNA glycosylase AlkD
MSLPRKASPGYAQAVKMLRAHASPARAASAPGFFKAPDNQRSSRNVRDVFLGVTTPQLRRIARQFYTLPLPAVRKLMASTVHEERSLGHAVLRMRFEHARKKDDAREQEKLFRFYVKHRGYIRAWDGVDDSAPYIVGRYLLACDKTLLYELAGSASLWDRRMAMVSTWWFIRNGHIADTLKLAKILLHDEQDLIHKACGWMLREVGKKDVQALRKFLDRHKTTMPRTMLRYAIEKFSERERKKYLQR